MATIVLYEKKDAFLNGDLLRHRKTLKIRILILQRIQIL